MDFAVLWLPIVGAAFMAVAGTIWGTNGNKTVALWVGFPGACMILVAIALNLQQIIWKEEAADKKQAPTDAEVRQMRAYINVVDARVTQLAVGKPIIGYVTFKNTGQTPGHDVKAWIGVGLVKHPVTEKPMSHPADFNPPGFVLAAGGVHPVGKDVPHAVTPEDMQNLQAGSYAIRVWGGVTYKDAYGNPRETGFRYLYARETGLPPSGAMTAMHEGNFAN